MKTKLNILRQNVERSRQNLQRILNSNFDEDTANIKFSYDRSVKNGAEDKCIDGVQNRKFTVTFGVEVTDGVVKIGKAHAEDGRWEWERQHYEARIENLLNRYNLPAAEGRQDNMISKETAYKIKNRRPDMSVRGIMDFDREWEEAAKRVRDSGINLAIPLIPMERKGEGR